MIGVTWRTSAISTFGSDIVLKASVRSGYSFHTFQADFSPLPKKEDDVSHPVRLWKAPSTGAFGPSRQTISWIGRLLMLLPVPYDTQRCLSPLIFWNRLIAITTTSLSFVFIRTLSYPSWAAAATCSMILESASSWLHGEILSSADGGLLIALDLIVLTRSLSWNCEVWISYILSY